MSIVTHQGYTPGTANKESRGSKYMTPGTDEGEGHQGKSEPVLKRGYRPFKQRSIAWYNPKDGHILHDDGSKAIVEPYSPLVTILSHVHSRVLYLLPDEGGSFPGRSWYLETVKSGYTLKKYLSKTKSATITGEGLTVDIYPVDQYFDNPPSLTACRAAHLKLTEMLQVTFRSEYALVMGTASYTGSNLLIMSLPRERTDEGMKAREYKTLSQDIRDTVIGNSGQGRIETFSPKQEMIDQLYEIDGVFMYAACLRDVPTGPVTHDESNEYAGYTSGFYRIVATVPETWQHIGLLPFYDKIASRKGRDVRTVYPNVPGTQFETWATHHELRLAYEHNWTIDIKERLLWTERSSDPLRTWGEKLKALRETANDLPEPVRSMLRSAIRAIVLKAIGGFHRHEIKWDGYKPLIDWNEGQGIDNIDTFASEGDTVHYQQSAQFTGQQLTMLHPEWTMDIWGKSRVKIARAALSLPYKSIIALRTDGIWCTEKPAPVGIWEETGKPGSWRAKYSVTGPIAWPKNNAEMVTLIQTVKKQGKVG